MVLPRSLLDVFPVQRNSVAPLIRRSVWKRRSAGVVAAALVLGALGCGSNAPSPADQDGLGGDSSPPDTDDELPKDDLPDEEPATSQDGWRLVWSDEFEGSGAPSSKHWNFETRDPGWVNHEEQHYAGSRHENVRQEDGLLIIEAHRDHFNDYEFSSARIHSRGKAEFLYGRFEARARLPQGRGTWPAIWMLPADEFRYATTCSAETGRGPGCNWWPNSGEIDIMEHVGYDPGVVHGSIHCARYSGAQAATGSTVVANPSEDFHIYAVEWSPSHISFFVDDDEYYTYENIQSDWQTWPFDAPFYFVLNLAVGGTWGGVDGVDPDAFPARLEVDYVRAYEWSE